MRKIEKTWYVKNTVREPFQVFTLKSLKLLTRWISEVPPSTKKDWFVLGMFHGLSTPANYLMQKFSLYTIFKQIVCYSI